MATKPMKVPGPEHPIRIEKEPRRIIVKVAGRTLADTRAALILREADYPPVYYVPRADADMSLMTRTKHVTYCPYKGKCSYYSIPSGGTRALNAVWSYEEPYDAVSEIKEHIAFYPDRVDSIERID